MSSNSCFTLPTGGMHGEEISFPGSLFFDGRRFGVLLHLLSSLEVSIPFFWAKAFTTYPPFRPGTSCSLANLLQFIGVPSG